VADKATAELVELARGLAAIAETQASAETVEEEREPPPTALNTTISKLVNPVARCDGGPDAAATRFQCAASGEDWITAGPPGARRQQRAATPPG
jgi:hypothetical protein